MSAAISAARDTPPRECLAQPEPTAAIERQTGAADLTETDRNGVEPGPPIA